jgi:hypothetical protein
MAPAGPQGMAPYGQGGPMAMGSPGAMLSAATGPSSGPTRRNALMTMLMPFGVGVGVVVLGFILTIITGSVLISLVQMLLVLGIFVWFLLTAVIPMVNELKFVTRNESLAWWPFFVPFYGFYWMWIIIPQEVAKAKQMLGVQQPPRSIVHYIFLWPFALASDINDMVR